MRLGQPCLMKVISVIRTVGRWKIVREILGKTGVGEAGVSGRVWEGVFA